MDSSQDSAGLPPLCSPRQGSLEPSDEEEDQQHHHHHSHSLISSGSGNEEAAALPQLVSPDSSVTDLSSLIKTAPVADKNVSVESEKRVKGLLQDTLPEVECLVRARIPTTSGTEIFLHLYHNNVDKKEHLAIVFGNTIRSKSLDRPRPGETEMDRMIRGAYVGRLYPGRQSSSLEETSSSATNNTNNTTKNPDPVLVRIHSECYTGETTWSARCDCGEQLDEAGAIMTQEGCGVVVYLRQEGRGIGLSEKLKAYNLQDLGADTVTANLLLRHPADARSYGLATAILLDLGLHDIRLLTNNPDKVVAVEGKHKEIQVVERVPMIPLAWQQQQDSLEETLNGNNNNISNSNDTPQQQQQRQSRSGYTTTSSASSSRPSSRRGIHSKEIDGYLRTKIERMGHLLQQPE